MEMDTTAKDTLTVSIDMTTLRLGSSVVHIAESETKIWWSKRKRGTCVLKKYSHKIVGITTDVYTGYAPRI